jgi:hypothetical protein
MALRREVVDLFRLGSIEQFDQVRRVGDVAVVQKQTHAIDVRILIEVVNALRVKRGSAADDAMYLVVFRSIIPPGKNRPAP